MKVCRVLLIYRSGSLSFVVLLVPVYMIYLTHLNKDVYTVDSKEAEIAVTLHAMVGI